MTEPLHAERSAYSSKRRRMLAPHIENAFAELNERVFADGALTPRVKELIAIAVAHATQSATSIRTHTHRAMRRGAKPEEVAEAIWVAVEMRAEAAVELSTIAMDAIGPMARTSQPIAPTLSPTTKRARTEGCISDSDAFGS